MPRLPLFFLPLFVAICSYGTQSDAADLAHEVNSVENYLRVHVKSDDIETITIMLNSWLKKEQRHGKKRDLIRTLEMFLRLCQSVDNLEQFCSMDNMRLLESFNEATGNSLDRQGLGWPRRRVDNLLRELTRRHSKVCPDIMMHIFVMKTDRVPGELSRKVGELAEPLIQANWPNVSPYVTSLFVSRWMQIDPDNQRDIQLIAGALFRLAREHGEDWPEEFDHQVGYNNQQVGVQASVELEIRQSFEEHLVESCNLLTSYKVLFEPMAFDLRHSWEDPPEAFAGHISDSKREYLKQLNYFLVCKVLLESADQLVDRLVEQLLAGGGRR